MFRLGWTLYIYIYIYTYKGIKGTEPFSAAACIYLGLDISPCRKPWTVSLKLIR